MQIGSPRSNGSPGAEISQSTSCKPIRIGIWLLHDDGNRHKTISPAEGIGVITSDLVKGLLRQSDKVEVVVLVLDQDRQKIEAVLGAHSGLSVVSPQDSVPGNGQLTIFGSLSRNCWQVIQNAAKKLLACLKTWKRSVWSWLDNRLEALLANVRYTNPIFLLRLTFFTSVWVLFASVVAYARASRAVFLGLRERFGREKESQKQEAGNLEHLVFQAMQADLQTRARKAGCDIWCVPSVNVTLPTGFPVVLFLYDTIPNQFPGWIAPNLLIRANMRTFSNVNRADLVGCMTETVRLRDLEGALGLPTEKMRAVLTAAPRAPKLGKLEALSLIGERARFPYLFYPTVARPHKNIPNLILALYLLRTKYRLEELELVLTGPWEAPVLQQCLDLIAGLGLRSNVHILDFISRDHLAALYQEAHAVVLPSLAEGVGLQLQEALEQGCPVTCSRILVFEERCQCLEGTVPFFDPEDPAEIARTVFELHRNRETVRQLQQSAYHRVARRTWTDVAGEWLPHFRYAANLSRIRSREFKSNGTAAYRIFLMLQVTWPGGGVWEATKDLLKALSTLNAERGLLDLVFAATSDQPGMTELKQWIQTERLVFSHQMDALECEGVNLDSHEPVLRDEACYCSFVGNLSALRADALFAMTDRFCSRLQTECPYGVIVYDVIQHHLPEIFDHEFGRLYREAIIPTLQNAHVVVTTNPVTAADVGGILDRRHEHIHVVPVACEPHKRFGGLRIAALESSKAIILNPSNSSPHKGAKEMLLAFRLVVDKLGENAPRLVMCGPNVEKFSPRRSKSNVSGPWVDIRKLVVELGFVEGEEVVFLPQIADQELGNLYATCSVVVNAGKFDNGTFNLIEGAYFGKPVISTRYPAAEWLYQRFGIPVRYFEVDDIEGLASHIIQALVEPPVSNLELQKIRKQLCSPELGLQRYAERIYEKLVELGREGRRRREERLAA